MALIVLAAAVCAWGQYQGLVEVCAAAAWD
jgi:hypothetical protein